MLIMEDQDSSCGMVNTKAEFNNLLNNSPFFKK